MVRHRFRKPASARTCRFKSCLLRISACSSVDRAFASGVKGREFKSHQVHFGPRSGPQCGAHLMINKNSKQEFSAGGVVYKKEVGQILWLVAKHSGYHKWVLPKGLVEKGEGLAAAAVKEVEEECGIKTKVVAKIPEPEKYIYTMNNVKIFKMVNYFLMEYVSGDIANHDFEMEEVGWLEFEEAKEKLNFHGAKKVLEKARDLLI